MLGVAVIMLLPSPPSQARRGASLVSRRRPAGSSGGVRSKGASVRSPRCSGMRPMTCGSPTS